MVFKEGHNPQVWKFLPARRIKGVYQILQIQEKSGLHTHQFFGTKCLAANIGLAAIAVLVDDGNKCFFIYFATGLKEAADHPQLGQARSVSGNFIKPTPIEINLQKLNEENNINNSFLFFADKYFWTDE